MALKPLGKKPSQDAENKKAETFIQAAQKLCDHTPAKDPDSRNKHHAYLMASHKLLLLSVGRVNKPELRDRINAQAKIVESVLQGYKMGLKQRNEKELLDALDTENRKN